MRSLLGATWPYLIAVACAAAVLYWAHHSGYQSGFNAAEQRWAKVVNESNVAASLETARLEREQRTIEQDRQAAAQAEGERGNEKKSEIAASAAAAADSVNSMLDAAASYGATSSAVCGNPAAARRSDGATAAAMVLSELLDRSTRRYADLARAYEELRVSAETCVNTYNTMRGR